MPEIRRIVEETGTIERTDAPPLAWQGFVPDSEPAGGILLFVHGLAEHFGRYGFPVDHFTQKGFPCYGLDLRGHGRSGGRRAHVDRFSDYLSDVDALVDVVRVRHPEAPLVLVGHSMGGVVSIHYALAHGDRLRGLILSSPGLRAHPETAPPSWLLFLGRIASVLVPKLHFSSGLPPAFVSRDPEVVRAYVEDPLVQDKVSARWATEFIAAQKSAFREAEHLEVPTLVLQSGSDRLVDPAATRRWAEQAPQEITQFHEWPGLYHEMFNEPEREKVFEKMDSWLADRLE